MLIIANQRLRRKKARCHRDNWSYSDVDEVVFALSQMITCHGCQRKRRQSISFFTSCSSNIQLVMIIMKLEKKKLVIILALSQAQLRCDARGYIVGSGPMHLYLNIITSTCHGLTPNDGAKCRYLLRQGI